MINMFFQADSEFAIVIEAIFIRSVVQIVMFIIGMYVVRWYAKKESKHYTKVWDTSLKTALIVNLSWLIINIPLNFTFNFMLVESVYIDLIISGINIFIGTLLVAILYEKELRESFLFVVVVQLIILCASLIVGFLITIIIGFIVSENYEIALYILKIGLPVTLLLTLLGLLIGFILGMVLALMRIYSGVELSWIARTYEKIFRGIPVLVLIYIFAYGFTGLFWFIDPLERPLASIVLALGLRSGAYQSQIFRGAILSVSPGQTDAARAIGMNESQAFLHIIFPQAIRLAVPSWSNEYAVVIKDSSFAYAVGIVEMTKVAYDYSYAFKGTWALSISILAILYLLLTFPITKLFGERQTKKLKELGLGGG
jgi:polar amino acid transport system permease protein